MRENGFFYFSDKRIKLFLTIFSIISMLFGNEIIFCQKSHNYLFSNDTVTPRTFDSTRSHFITDSLKTVNDSSENKRYRKYDLQTQFLNMIESNDPSEKLYQQKKDYYETVNRFIPYKDKIIRSIIFKKIDVFGQSVTDTTHTTITKLEKTINDLHQNTRTEVLRNRLIFVEGDKLNPLILADNERLFREMTNIHDARILIREASPYSDSVDIMILTKDVLPAGFGGELSSIQSGYAGIWNKNLLGFGQELYLYLLWDYSKNSNYGYRTEYKINDIGKTFISADASYENHWGEQQAKLSFNRTFFTPQTKYAGGLDISRTIRFQNIFMPDTLLENFRLGYYFYDFWLGRSIPLTTNFKSQIRQNIAITGRVFRYDYFDYPGEVSNSLLHEYTSRTDFVGSVSLSRQAFLQSRLINGFGRPEDIPYGMLLSITAGYEINKFISRPYLGLSFASGSYINDFGFYDQNIQIGSYLHMGHIEEGVINLSGKYFTRLLNPLGRYNFRYFIKVNYKLGINRFADERISLSNSEGIRGLSSDSLTGNQRFYLNFESDCYSPNKILGFRFVYFAFLDAGLISNNRESLLKNALYTGFGVGVRIRNENLVFNTIQIRIGYYPVLPNAPSVRYIDFTGLGNTPFPTFSNSKPDLVSY